uniref:Methyltransf_21 domain-containing protein n=1 Tax=Panagrellus redivivus TaxID=6233 RepID=A0A7E4VBV0_PANRE
MEPFAPGFENDIQNVPGLDEWGPKMLTQYDRILKVDYCPNVDDFLRIIPLEGSRCDRCDFNYEGIKYKFFDYKNHGFKEPYSRYTEGKHKIVYIVDVGGPRAELEGSLIELEAIAVNHSVKIDVFYNKMENLHNMKERDFHAFDFQNLEPHRKFGYTPSSFVDAEFLKRITTGRMTSDFSEFVNYGKSTTTLSLFLGRGISY